MASGNRRKSRELALQVLFQAEFGDPKPLKERLSYFQQSFSIKPEVLEYTLFLLAGIDSECDKIDAQLQSLSKNWKLERMSLVDKNILRIAAYELLHGKDTPPKVVINEAIEMAKQYSSLDAFQFINGVLDALSLEKHKEGT